MNDPFSFESSNRANNNTNNFNDQFTSFDMFKAKAKSNTKFESFKSIGQNENDFQNFDFHNSKIY